MALGPNWNTLAFDWWLSGTLLGVGGRYGDCPAVGQNEHFSKDASNDQE